jgi:alpha-tubulin suppressor-like RCC1 family protein
MKGCKIQDVSISTTHILIIDIYGRLWAIGQNRYGQLGLGHLCDQSNPKQIPLPSPVARVISVTG